MIKTKNISEMLTFLIEEYRFNKNTLSKYLEITEETIDGVVMGNVECLLDDPALPITTPSIVSSVISKYFERVFLLKRYSSIKEVNISEIYFFYHICALISTCIIYNIACNKCPYVKGTLYTLLLLSSIFRAIITFPIYVYQMLQNLDASSRFMIDERKLGLLFWNTFRLSKKAALFSVFISEKVASSF